ncbi:MAG: RloB domain-containing protein [Candidatus Thiodiazotropha sp. LLP2]
MVSIPCFELWLLLHFEDITAPMGRNEVLARLRQHIPSYDKGLNGTFALTVCSLPSAIQKTEQLAQENSAYTEPMPYTGVVELVRLMTEMSLPKTH